MRRRHAGVVLISGGERAPSQWCASLRLTRQEANGAKAQLWVFEQRFNKDKKRKRAYSFSECWQVFYAVEIGGEMHLETFNSRSQMDHAGVIHPSSH